MLGEYRVHLLALLLIIKKDNDYNMLQLGMPGISLRILLRNANTD